MIMRTIAFLFTGALTACVSVGFPSQAAAQDWYTGLTYDMSVPAGDLQEFSDEFSWRGIGLTFRKEVSKTMTAGLFFGWNVFHERTTETIEIERGAVTGTQDRTLNAFPMMVNAHYYLGDRGDIRPYIGLNAGGWIVLQRLEVGILAVEKDSFEWGIAPEIGTVIPISRDVTLLLNGKFNYAFTGEGLAGNDFNLSYYGINVGFAWQQY
jgi:hypothetical protein